MIYGLCHVYATFTRQVPGERSSKYSHVGCPLRPPVLSPVNNPYPTQYRCPHRRRFGFQYQNSEGKVVKCIRLRCQSVDCGPESRSPVEHSHSRSRPFDKLATETIRNIFSLACPDVILNLKWTIVLFQSVLCLVCQRWRGIATSHHSLWANFKIDPRGEWNPIFSSQLFKYLQKSGAHPLRIRVWDDGCDKVLLDILDAIIPHCKRWDKIKFYFPLEYHFLQKLEAVRDRLPLLQRLRITGPLDRYPTETHRGIFRNTPLLNYISVENMNLDTVRMLGLPWNQVTRAELDCSSFLEMQSTLELSQTLTTLTLFEGYGSLEQSPIALEKLQALRVYHGVGVGDLICPSLKRLETFDEEASGIQDFLNNSSCALTHLKLRGLGNYHSNDYIPPILQRTTMAGLTYLQLDDEWFTDEIVGVLILDYRRLLPVLETLYVAVGLDSLSIDERCKSRIRGLRRIVESRTYDNHSSTGILSNLNATTLNDTIVMSLKVCHFKFIRHRGRWDEWQDGKLQCLRTFCDSRGALIVLRKVNGVENRIDGLIEQHVDPCDSDECYHDNDDDDNDE